jgi:hypothetical protein
MNSITVGQLDDLCRVVVRTREDYDAAAKTSAEYDKIHKTAKAELMEALNKLGKKSYTVDGLGTVSKVERLKVSVPKDIDSRREMIDYFLGQGENISSKYLTVNSMSLNSWYRQEAENDPTFELPGVGEPTIDEYLRITRKK